MKEIKAFIRKHRIVAVLQALHDSGFCDQCGGGACYNITVFPVQRPFASEDPSQQHYSVDLAEPVVAEYRLELACPPDLARSVVDVIVQAAHTGQPEGGWVFVSDIQTAVPIR